jgi:hypothetical protein
VNRQSFWPGNRDDAVCEFAVEYAHQNQRDYRTFIKAVREGRIKTIIED